MPKLSEAARSMLLDIHRDAVAHESVLNNDVLDELSRAGLVFAEELPAFTSITLTEEGERTALLILRGESDDG